MLMDKFARGKAISVKRPSDQQFVESFLHVINRRNDIFKASTTALIWSLVQGPLSAQKIEIVWTWKADQGYVHLKELC